MKKHIKFLKVALTGTLATCLLIGCSNTSGSASIDQGTTSNVSQDTQTDITQEVAEDITPEPTHPTVDREGNTIEVPDTLDRIVSTAPSNTEILVELGLGEQIIGIDKWSNDIIGLSEDLTLIDFQNPDAEALIALEPDIIIASGHNRAGTDDPFALLKEAGICVVYIPTSNSIQGIYEDILFLGELTDTLEQAELIIDDMQQRIDAIESIASTIETPKSVYFEVAPVPYMTAAGGDTFIDDFITTLGATNIFSEQEPWFSPSAEAIIEANPDVIITNADYAETPVEEILSREGWDVINAVANDEVYLVNANTSSRASHLSILALEEMARVIYPEYYE